MSDRIAIAVDGLKDFRSELKALGADLPKALQQVNKQAATDVANQVAAVYGALHSPVSGRGAASIRGLASATGAQVAIGGARTSYLLGQEFGANRRDYSVGAGLHADHLGARGTQLKHSSMHQFPPYVPSPSGRGGRGYFLYPTIRQYLPKMIAAYSAAIGQLAKRAFPS